MQVPSAIVQSKNLATMEQLSPVGQLPLPEREQRVLVRQMVPLF
ncbi:MAG: hypothetical protein NTV68_16805 [Methanomicrobiales archaeon]|nr:hypothetical protein [Methanomicrobiales archaeon]